MAKNGKFPWFSWLITLVLLGSAISASVWYLKQPAAEPPDYRTGAVSKGDLTQAVTATGQLNPVVNVQVGSQISGIISKLYVDYNSIVKSNQVVAELDPATYRAAVNQSKGNVANTQAALELAQINARRAEELRKNDLIAQSDYDNTIGLLHQAEAQVMINKAALERAQVDLDRCTIFAPIDGIVISRSVDVGQTVAASLSAPVLFVIANDLTRMQIDANVSEADVGGVEVSQTVNFTVDAFPGRTFTGKVIQIRNSPITVQNVVTYDTVVEVANKDMKLKPGMTANVSIVIAQKQNALRIPNAATRFKPPEIDDSNDTRWDKLLAKMGIKEKEAKKSDAAGKEKAVAANDAEKSDGGGARGQGRGEGGGPGSGRGPGGSGKRRGTSSVKTVYVLSTNTVASTGLTIVTPKAVQIKTGIGDGSYTEVLDGLNEGDQVITSQNVLQTNTKAAPASNPFGGGMRRF